MWNHVTYRRIYQALSLDIRGVFNMVNKGITRQGYIPAEEVATLFGGKRREKDLRSC